MNKSEIAERAAHELTTLDRHPEMRGRGPGCLCADCENARKLIVERAIAESQAPQPERICICEPPDYEGQSKLNGGWDKKCPVHGETEKLQQQLTDANALKGYWGTADWLYCTDGRWRPVEAGTFPLADGAAFRLGRLRGYGDAINAQVAKAFIESYLETRKEL